MISLFCELMKNLNIVQIAIQWASWHFKSVCTSVSVQVIFQLLSAIKYNLFFQVIFFFVFASDMKNLNPAEFSFLYCDLCHCEYDYKTGTHFLIFKRKRVLVYNKLSFQNEINHTFRPPYFYTVYLIKLVHLFIIHFKKKAARKKYMQIQNGVFQLITFST